ncbi:MAG: hypothetical protein H6Q68_2705 [Firmicutes bacterium]|nr:hypothetical protein [Bacillota bacterium]
MPNVYYHNGYCKSMCGGNPNTDISEKAAIGGYVLFVIALTAIVLHGVFTGIYIDPAFLI